MNKQKIKDFISAFEECDANERAQLLVKMAKVQRDQDPEERVKQLQAENNFLTLRVAELQMKLNSKPFGVFGEHEIQPISDNAKEATPENVKIAISDIKLPNAGFYATCVTDEAFEKLKSEMNGREFVSNINAKGHLVFTPKNNSSQKEITPENATIAKIDPLPNAEPAVFVSDSDLERLRGIAKKGAEVVKFNDMAKTSLHKKENPDKWQNH